jgi:serine/threonine-protein kinase
VFSRIPLEVFADGRRVGTTDESQILLTAGRHEIELVSDRFLYRAKATVSIKSGDATPFNVKLPDGAVRVITADGAEIWIEGERIGVAPMSAVSVPIGTREVVVKSPEFGERRSALEVRFGQVSEIMLLPQMSGGTTPPKLAPLSGGRTQFVH